MAGHSKFKNIMHRKGRQDKAKSKLFSKLSRDITLAAKQGLPDINANSRLRLAVAAAKAGRCPRTCIDRAIKKASSNEADNMEEIRYEGFGPGGVGLIVEVLTDNRQPRRRQCAHGVRQERRGLGRDRLGRLHVRPHGPDRLSGLGRLAKTPIDGGRHRGGRRGRRERRRGRPRHLHRLRPISAPWSRRWTPVLGAPKSTAIIWRPKPAVPVSGDPAADPAEADRRAGRRRRRADRVRQLRDQRRGNGPPGGVSRALHSGTQA